MSPLTTPGLGHDLIDQVTRDHPGQHTDTDSIGHPHWHNHVAHASQTSEKPLHNKAFQRACHSNAQARTRGRRPKHPGSNDQKIMANQPKLGSPGMSVGQSGDCSCGRWRSIGPQESMTSASAALGEWNP